MSTSADRVTWVEQPATETRRGRRLIQRPPALTRSYPHQFYIQLRYRGGSVAIGCLRAMWSLHYRARYYDGSAGRFIAEDPIRFAAGPNFFRYVDNSPVVRKDPTGKGGPIAIAAPLIPEIPVAGQIVITGAIAWGTGRVLGHMPVGQGMTLDDAVTNAFTQTILAYRNRCENKTRQDDRCVKAKAECIEICSETTLPTYDRTSQGFPFFKCLNRCLTAAGCLGK